MDRRVLITGASGFIGKHLTGALAKTGWEVRAAARDPSAIPNANGVERVAMADLAQRADWPALLDGMTHIVHLAGIADAPGTLPDALYTRINAKAVGELAQAASGKVARLVFLSSVRAQAGLSAEQPIKETDTPEPTDAYGQAKLEGERLLAASGVPFTVLRSAVVYGKGVKGNLAALATLARTPAPLPLASLENRRSLLALDNLVTAISFALESSQAENETFLVADAEPISVAGLVAAMREGLGQSPHLVKMPLGVVKRLMRSFGREAEWERMSGSFVVDVSKLMGLGWRPMIATRDGIIKMMRSETGTVA